MELETNYQKWNFNSMAELDKNQKIFKESQPRDHLANERTFLAWIRTSIGIMAFGFVVEKFSIFIRQAYLFIEKEHLPNLNPPSPLQGYSSIFGSLLIALGVLICLLAFVKFKNVEKQIDDDSYKPAFLLNVLLALVVISMGVFLIIYLSNSF